MDPNLGTPPLQVDQSWVVLLSLSNSITDMYMSSVSFVDAVELKGWVTGGAIPSESSRYSSMRSRRVSASAESRRSSLSRRKLRALATLSATAS